MKFEIVKKDYIDKKESESSQHLDNYTIYHTSNWLNVLKDTFGWDINSLSAYRNGKIIFYLPYVNKYRFDLKRYNVALPLSHNLGPAISGDIDKDNLLDVIKEISKIGNFEIHNRVDIKDLEIVSDHTLTTLELNKFSNLEELFNSLNKSSIQRKIKKAEKEGVVVKKVVEVKSYKVFSELQNKTRKRQGSPAYPKSFFENIRKHFEKTDFFNLYLAYHNEKPVAGVLFTNFRKVAIYGYGASLNNRDILRLGVNQAVMWEAIKNAYKSGCHTVDFGKTPLNLTDLQQYKEKWGTKTEPLYYSYTKDRKTAQVDREGLTTKAVSFCLHNCPYVIFSNLSPYLLKLVL